MPLPRSRPLRREAGKISWRGGLLGKIQMPAREEGGGGNAILSQQSRDGTAWRGAREVGRAAGELKSGERPPFQLPASPSTIPLGQSGPWCLLLCWWMERAGEGGGGREVVPGQGAGPLATQGALTLPAGPAGGQGAPRSQQMSQCGSKELKFPVPRPQAQ